MLQEMRVRNYSECTVRNYVSSIAYLAKHYNLSPEKITREQVKSYAYHLIQNKHVSVSSINQLISAWKIFQVDILRNEWEDFRLKRPKREKKIPQVLSQQEALQLIDTPRNLKHKMILKLAYATGLRRGELLALQLKHIDSARNIIRVIKGKGNKSREVPAPLALIEELRQYYKRFRPKTYLFEGYKPGNPYSATSIEKIVKDAAQRAGIKKDMYPHVLRHSFATHMLEKGVNLKRLQIILGHSSMKTTSVYLHLANSDSVDLPNLLEPKRKQNVPGKR